MVGAASWSIICLQLGLHRTVTLSWVRKHDTKPSAVQVHDRMTEQVYPRPLQSFKTDMVPTPVFTVPIMEQGAAALEQINEVQDKGWTPATLSALCCC